VGTGRHCLDGVASAAAYTHILSFGVSDADLIARTRKTYAGPLVVGSDLMSFDIGDTVSVTSSAK